MKTSRIDLTRRKGEHGGVVAYTVMSALFLFLAVGLGVDLSHLYTVKTELQNAADAAALAGCTPLDEPDAAKIEEAVDRAIKVLNSNKYNFNNKEFVPGGVDVDDLADLRQYVRFAVNLADFDTGDGLSEADAAATPTNIRFVRVITPSVPVSVFFSVPILGAFRNMNATAVAGFSVPGNTSFCILPLTAVACNPGDADCKLGCDKKKDPTCADRHSGASVPVLTHMLCRRWRKAALTLMGMGPAIQNGNFARSASTRFVRVRPVVHQQETTTP